MNRECKTGYAHCQFAESVTFSDFLAKSSAFRYNENRNDRIGTLWLGKPSMLERQSAFCINGLTWC